MRYVAAYLLAVLAGNESPDLAALEKILSSVGVKVDQEKAKKVIGELKGKSIETLIKDGTAKLATVPSGGAAAAAPAAAAGGAKKEEPSKTSFFFYTLFLCFRFVKCDANFTNHIEPASQLQSLTTLIVSCSTLYSCFLASMMA